MRIENVARSRAERRSPHDPMKVRLPLWIFTLLAIAYVIAPGAPGAPVSGIPIGQTGSVALVLIVGASLWARRARPDVGLPAVLIMAIVIAIKISLAAISPEPGWLARYYANETLQGPVERSIDYPRLGDATRVDRRLAMKNTEFPVHFFNNREYNTGVYRETALPFSVRWTGYVFAGDDQRLTGTLSANGRAELLVDGTSVATASTTGASPLDVSLPAGPHALEVRYQKPADTEPMINLALGEINERIAPDAADVFAVDRAWTTVVAWVLHLFTLLTYVVALAPAIRAAASPDLVIEAAVLIALMLQGLWKSQHLVGHVWTMSGGDDWLNYEMTGRDGALHGAIMSQGGVIGRGQPFSLYPGYAYFLMLVHQLTGESLAGVVLANFIALGVTTVIAYRIARHLFGPAGALGALAWLMLIEQADFVRYYTVSLFSENLYVVLVALTVWFLIRHHDNGRRRELLWAGLAGALAAWTRPSMMLMLPLAIAGIALARLRIDGLRRVALSAVLFATVWMAALLPITIRNYVMSGRAVLLTSGQGASFILYNMPVNDPRYFKGYDGTLFNAALVMTQMLVEHPVASLQNYGTKLGFSLGMVHWMGSGTIHPELLATSAAYAVAIITIRRFRSLAALPLHCFVITHVATLMLTMPSNYGYRMILPAFVFMSLGAGAVIVAPLIRAAASRSAVLARLVAQPAS
jgi:hypothetical protein